MNLTADLAVVAIAALALTDTVLSHRFRMKVADRLRVVNPAKAQQDKDTAGQRDGGKDKTPDLKVAGGGM